jgi:uncharacterized protein
MIAQLKPNSIGLGLRTDHYSYVEKNLDTINLDWFEVISENHMNSEGRPVEILDIVSKKFPLTFHGVSLSIASREELNQDYLLELKKLIDQFQPLIVSDHLCWTGTSKSNLHNLLPFSYDLENLNYLCSRIDQVQNIIKKPITLENLSAYFNYKESNMTEWDFIRELSFKSGCNLLLDVNNIYVNSQNHQFDPKSYIDQIPSEKITHIHLAGFSDYEDFLFDTHSKPVYPEVWDLYEYTIRTKGCKPTMIEWDEDIPDFPTLLAEAEKARDIMTKLSL